MALAALFIVIIIFFITRSCQATLLDDDRQALLQIKLSLQLQNANPSILNDWINPASRTKLNITGPCAWSRITCSSVDNLARVTGLDLSSLSIAGTLPISTGFSHLTALSHLNLSHNLLTGPIPEDIANCSQLVFLDLSFNSFSSFLAPQAGLSLLPNLQFLNLGSNNISSALSQAIHPIHCFSLQTLNLSNNFFKGLSSISWKNCTSLQALDLSYNPSLAGPLPTSLPDNLPSLHHLVIASSNLKGPIPSSLCSKGPLLDHLDLSGNKLSGNFPLFLTNCSSLQYLDLSGNSLTGEISSQLANLTSLELLNLSENLLEGSLPAELGKLTALQVLMVGSNSLVGAIPSELSNCKSLILLDLNTNHLEGNLPEVLSQMLSLKYLVLHSNAFTGTIPSSFLNASKVLRFLDLSNNSFSGSISPQFVNLSSLQFLLLAANNFGGEIPTELGELAGLEFLDLSSNQLHGSIPSSVGQLPNLLWLMLANNDLTGKIPSQLGNCTSLLWLNLRSNFLTGELPEELAGMGRDSRRTFTSNSKTMNPPKALGECLLLKRWIPENYPPYSFMYDNLDKSRCKSFWIELLSGSPQLSSGCPQTQGSGGYIQVTGNLLTGPVPSILQSGHTSILLLGSNLFNGSLPGGLGTLLLRHLNVSHNRLSGTIPSAIADNKCLTLLDLSNNNLSGSLPQSLGSLSRLSIFNVSYNPLLSGSIPSLGQLHTFGSDSYVGDPLLCYEILPGMRGTNASFTTLPLCNSPESSSNSTVIIPDDISGSSSKYRIAKVILSCSAVLICSGAVLYVVRRLSILHGMFTHRHDVKFGITDLKNDMEDRFRESKTHSRVCAFSNGAAALPFPAVKQLTYAEIQLSTNNFNEDNVVGCGGFGIVYKAKLSDGSTVAIKRLTHYGMQGEREFVAEMQTLGNIVHESLVPLLGCCIFGKEKLLIYKYLCNGSLEDWLHEKEGGAETLTWPRRLKIAKNCAKALSHLHHECTPVLIHRDIKAGNVLLDEEFNAYLADFGLARKLDPGETHVSTVVAGTLGYVAPEYSQTWRATTKGDVYSFGVMMLELITGRHAVRRSFGNSDINNIDVVENDDEGMNLVEWVRGLMREGRGHEAFHAVVKQTGEGHEEELLRFIEVAHACSLELPEQRPSMKAVACRLESLQDR